MRLLYYYIVFAVLSAAGFYLLWGLMLQNGTARAMGAVKETRTFPDGAPLRTTFTGLPALDSRLLSAVVFYDGLLNRADPVHGLLLVDLHAAMQATALCMLVESRRGGGKSPLRSAL